MYERGEFHVANGLTYKRVDAPLGQGMVRVRLYADEGRSEQVAFEYTMTGAEWASVVAAVSYSGDNAETWQAALAFHVEQPTPTTEAPGE
jgi:hypothetical protein